MRGGDVEKARMARRPYMVVAYPTVMVPGASGRRMPPTPLILWQPSVQSITGSGPGALASGGYAVRCVLARKFCDGSIDLGSLRLTALANTGERKLLTLCSLRMRCLRGTCLPGMSNTATMAYAILG